MLLPLLVSFALPTVFFLCFPASSRFSAVVHPSLPSVSPFSLVLFLLLRLLSALHSFSSLPYPVAPVTSFPSSSPVVCRRFFFAFKVFPLPLLSSVLVCQLRLWLQLFLRLSLLPPTLSFRCWLIYFPWFVSLFLRVLLLQLLLLSFLLSLLSPRRLFLFAVSSSTFYGSSCVFSGFFCSSFICCRPFCRLTSSRFFNVICSLLSLRFLVPRLTFCLCRAFLRPWGGGGGQVPQILILLNFHAPLVALFFR